MATSISDINDLKSLIENQNTIEDTPAAEEVAQETLVQDQVIPKQTPSDVLKNFKFDLSKISIVSSDNPIEISNQINKVFDRPAFDVVALQSGYRCSTSALNNNEIYAIRRLSGSEYEQNNRLFNFVFNKIIEPSYGPGVKYMDWLKLTAEEDFETLVYGLYCATFPKDNEFDVTCNKCSTTNKTIISKHSIVRADNPEATAAYIREVVNGSFSPAELIKRSVLNMDDRVILDETKTIVDIRTPSLFDYLQSLKTKENFAGYQDEIMSIFKNVKNMMIPHIESFEAGTPAFVDLKSAADRLKTIVKLPNEDRKALTTAINAKSAKYRVKYSLPDISCSNCGHTITNIRLDMIEQLFVNTVKA